MEPHHGRDDARYSEAGDPHEAGETADNPLLSIPKAGKEVGVSEYLIRKWIESGRLPAVKADNRYRVYRKELLDFIDKSRTLGQTPEIEENQE